MRRLLYCVAHTLTGRKRKEKHISRMQKIPFAKWAKGMRLMILTLKVEINEELYYQDKIMDTCAGHKRKKLTDLVSEVFVLERLA